jgi:S-adenosylmethionine:tRNA ribosyltransferase-isomerase
MTAPMTTQPATQPLTQPATQPLTQPLTQPGGDLDFTLPPELEAHEPPEMRGGRRDRIRLLVGRRGTGEVSHHEFGELPDLLAPGDVLVVNTSATLPAAVPVTGPPGGGPSGGGLVVHFSTELPDGTWAVELRRRAGSATMPVLDAVPGTLLALAGGGAVRLDSRYSDRLWRARVDTADDPHVPGYLLRHGRPIRYSYVPEEWPLSAYQTVFGRHPGSAEMPSAGRPFTPELVTRLVSAGIVLTPVTLHTGVASPEAHEKPYPERYRVPAATARLVNDVRRSGSRVVAVGTTVVRALESAVRPDGQVGAAAGWTSLVVTPERGVQAVDGMLTGFHEPRASHLLMLEAVAGRELLARCYAEALAAGYRWHEFGEANLLLP